jgi:hypothetical protein
MLLVQATQADWRAMARLPAADFEARNTFTRQLDRQLATAGELVRRLGLAGPGAAQIVRAQGAGPPQVTQGPFAAAQPFVARIWIVDCDSPQRAIAIAAQVSAAPGRGGVALNLPVEVRPMMSCVGEEM